MEFPHARHFPFSHSHAATGTLSYGLIAAPHFGQRDLGATIEIPSGMRVMHTFRKLPATIPNRKKKAMTTVRSTALRSRLVMSHTRAPASTNPAPYVPDA